MQARSRGDSWRLHINAVVIFFFVTENETADKASNWFFLVSYVLMAWTVMEVHTRKNPEGALTEVITLSGLSTRLVLQP